MNLRDDERADARPGVRTAERVAQLRGKLFLTRAGDEPAKGIKHTRGPVVESVAVAGEIRRCVSAEEIHAAAPRIEREAGEQARSGIEHRFVKDQKCTTTNGRSIRDAELS